VRKITATLVIVGLFTASAPAQLEQYVESIEVRVTNLDVVVTDRSGKPVTGLTREDFEIYEDGKLQPLTNFYEIRDTSEARAIRRDDGVVAPAPPDVPADVRRRRVLFFIDNYSIETFRRTEVTKGIDRFLERLLQPGDEAAVATWNRGLKLRQPFTSDRAAVQAAIRALNNASTGGSSMHTEADQIKTLCQQQMETALNSRGGNPGQAQQNCIADIAHYVDDLYANERALSASLSAMLTTLAGVEGKKVLVFAGAHLPDHPGEALFGWLEGYFAQLAATKPVPAVSLINRSRVARSMTTNLDAVARKANADGVTLYMIDAADPSRELMRDATSGGITGSDPGAAFTNYTGTLATFSAMAQMTGGIALTRTNNFDLAFETLARYRPAAHATEGDRSLVVKCKRPDVIVRTRRSYVSKSADEQVSDRVVANIFHTSLKSELTVTLTTGEGVRESRKIKLPITVSIPASSLTMLPDAKDMIGGFDVYVAVGDSLGAISSVTKKGQLVRVPAVAEAGLRKQPLVFTAQLLVRKGEHLLSVAVVDRLSGATGYARQSITAR
jgi:VWFA-related protein